MAEPITIRLIDLYRIGPGPSSSHTVGPMRAAAFFRRDLIERGIVPRRVQADLLGSLSATGHGHGTAGAVLAGLAGWDPMTCDVDALRELPRAMEAGRRIPWGDGELELGGDDVVFVPYDALGAIGLPHPNTMRLTAYDAEDAVVVAQTWCSIGGGFVQDPAGLLGDVDRAPLAPPVHAFHDGTSLLARAEAVGKGFGALVLENEAAWSSGGDDVPAELDAVWDAMRASIRRGLDCEGVLPGGLGLKRRARNLMERVRDGRIDVGYAHIARAQAYAFAVNEENAAGGRVVTAPTNGAAGILPAVLVETADRLELDRERIHRALATAGAIGMIIKTQASLSGAEVGCQGEVGSATAMAAAALCEILGGGPKQCEYAAEIAIEHNLGLTCDPLQGLVQAPCIERNAMGVAKVWSAAQLARHSGGEQLISLDRVVRVMKRTGEDMRGEYKETSRGGLAVSHPEC
jgi:L-serine dehydratase